MKIWNNLSKSAKIFKNLENIGRSWESWKYRRSSKTCRILENLLKTRNLTNVRISWESGKSWTIRKYNNFCKKNVVGRTRAHSRSSRVHSRSSRAMCLLVFCCLVWFCFRSSRFLKMFKLFQEISKIWILNDCLGLFVYFVEFQSVCLWCSWPFKVILRI